jgi:hypothetical protein
MNSDLIKEYEYFKWSLSRPPGHKHLALFSGFCTDHPSAIVCYDTDTFRGFTELLNFQDIVVELGCSYGKCTHLISKRVSSNRVLGIDVSNEVIAKAKENYTDINFQQCDLIATPYLAFKLVEDLIGCCESKQCINKTEQRTEDEKLDGFSQSETPRLVVFMDIGGNREMETNIALLAWVVADMPQKPDLIVVKSQSIYRFVSGILKGTLFTENCHIGAAFDWNKLLSTSESAFQNRKRKKEITLASESISPTKLQRFDEKVRKLPHPLKAPRRSTPAGIDICRFHNYSMCKNFVDPENRGTTCDLDHSHCHICLAVGHVAKDCVQQLSLV